MSDFVNDQDRKLARIVTIDNVIKHPNADALDLVIVGGWQCVAKLGEYREGDKVIYCEIDSLLPLENELFSFLALRESATKVFNGKAYHRLKSIKLRSELSQGLVVPVPKNYAHLPAETDLTQELGIGKYVPGGEDTLDADAEAVEINIGWYNRLIRWLMRGLTVEIGEWPHQLVKSEQTRIQNRTAYFNSAKETGESFEVSVKLDGASMTVFCVPTSTNPNYIRTGVTSRNGEISLDIPKLTFTQQCKYWLASYLRAHRNVFRNWIFTCPEWRTEPSGARNVYNQYCLDTGIITKLEDYYRLTGECITVQGELIGPGIQSNFEGVDSVQFFVYQVYRNGNVPLLPSESRRITKLLGLAYVPVINENFVIGAESNIKDLLKQADGPRALNPVKGTYREGVVFKSNVRPNTWKVISNAYLLKQED